MIALGLMALLVAAPQEAPVLDVPVYQSPAAGIAVPRPFPDWVFAPATERGTTTVIFQPHRGSLSDQLWGALVLAPWGQHVELSDIADRRVTGMWRSTLGPSFRLLVRDSVEVAGLPTIHTVMTGAINHAVLDVEEYLIARDSELIVLQFRYPRGLPRDSIAAGYARTMAGLRISRPERNEAAVLTPVLAGAARALGSAPPPPAESPWQTSVERGQVRFDLPEQLRAVAPGMMTSEVVVRGRRSMRFAPTVGPADTMLYAVGRFRVEVGRIGRLTLRLWRSESDDASVRRINDALLDVAADAWARYWRVFGPVPTSELTVVETAWSETHGGAAILFLGADADTTVIRRELSRTWWGGLVRADSGTGSLVANTLPEWALSLLDTRRPMPPAIAEARRAAGDARFREAVRTLLAESRDGPPAIPAFLRVLGDSASAPLRPLLR